MVDLKSDVRKLLERKSKKSSIQSLCQWSDTKVLPLWSNLVWQACHHKKNCGSSTKKPRRYKNTFSKSKHHAKVLQILKSFSDILYYIAFWFHTGHHHSPSAPQSSVSTSNSRSALLASRQWHRCHEIGQWCPFKCLCQFLLNINSTPAWPPQWNGSLIIRMLHWHW